MSEYSLQFTERGITILKNGTFYHDWDNWEWEDSEDEARFVLEALQLSQTNPKAFEALIDGIEDAPYDGIITEPMPADIQEHITQTMIEYGLIDKDGNVFEKPSPIPQALLEYKVPHKKSGYARTWPYYFLLVLGILFVCLYSLVLYKGW